ncbi:hypothetical protein CDAR_616431 [Caerostris darwini]|uniref:Uncharacterized protein n=1 Tax=Caerostris darwini TaxID=1538125 RepID=A0AAV4SIN2_9ARAC|nr:hypothetical protein CDAR_616431 [Caerostris darwini]
MTFSHEFYSTLNFLRNSQKMHAYLPIAHPTKMMHLMPVFLQNRRPSAFRSFNFLASPPETKCLTILPIALASSVLRSSRKEKCTVPHLRMTGILLN